MNYDEISRGIDEARWLMQRAETLAEKAIPFAVGRLQQLDIGQDVLRRLKRELSRYNVHTGRWKP